MGSGSSVSRPPSVGEVTRVLVGRSVSAEDYGVGGSTERGAYNPTFSNQRFVSTCL